MWAIVSCVRCFSIAKWNPIRIMWLKEKLIDSSYVREEGTIYHHIQNSWINQISFSCTRTQPCDMWVGPGWLVMLARFLSLLFLIHYDFYLPSYVFMWRKHVFIFFHLFFLSLYSFIHSFNSSSSTVFLARSSAVNRKRENKIS